MREIKFRAWDNLDKTMDRAENITYIENNRPSEFNDFVLMQYTGLKDRNGKEIYEGDIVKDGSRLWKIEISPIYGIFFILSNGDFASYLGDDFQVIGNIYENPELLKEG